MEAAHLCEEWLSCLERWPGTEGRDHANQKCGFDSGYYGGLSPVRDAVEDRCLSGNGRAQNEGSMDFFVRPVSAISLSVTCPRHLKVPDQRGNLSLTIISLVEIQTAVAEEA